MLRPTVRHREQIASLGARGRACFIVFQYILCRFQLRRVELGAHLARLRTRRPDLVGRRWAVLLLCGEMTTLPRAGASARSRPSRATTAESQAPPLAWLCPSGHRRKRGGFPPRLRIVV